MDPGAADPLKTFEMIVLRYSRYFDFDKTDFERLPLVFPTISIDTFRVLCETVRDHFQGEPMVLSLDAQTTIIGDLHGDIVDLFRALGKFGLPPRRTYLFLGDIVGRGEFSSECLSLVFCLKALFPVHVFIIRGKHEIAAMTGANGFADELKTLYPNKEPERWVLSAFGWMPLAARIGQFVLCAHGAIGPNIGGLARIAEISRPIEPHQDETVRSLSWSGPTARLDGFEYSPRGLGHRLGAVGLGKLLNEAGPECLVRGRECVEERVEMQLNRKVVTVRPENGARDVTWFGPTGRIRRAAVRFVPADSNTFGEEIRGSLGLTAPVSGTLPKLDNPSKRSHDCPAVRRGPGTRSPSRAIPFAARKAALIAKR